MGREKAIGSYLSKREQQIMEVLYRRSRATANEVMAELPGTPSNSTVRTLLRILEEKKEVTKTEEDGRYLYSPARPRSTAARSALHRLTETFFQGSVRDVVAALMDEQKLTQEDLDELQQMIDKARAEGR